MTFVTAYFISSKWTFMCVLSIKVPIRKKSGNLFNDPRISLFKLKKDFKDIKL